jgi:serine/threonine protein kinase/WD40 repeat protein
MSTGLGNPDTAVELFLTWVQDREDGRGPSFEGLCTQHSELRGRLAEIRTLHESARSLVERGEAPSQGGSRLVGTRYEVQGTIARGGMGEILAVRDPSLSRSIAIKVLRERSSGLNAKESRTSPEERLLAEAQILAQLDHPGIVPIYEVGRDDRGSPYFAMKRVDGQDFLAVIEAHHQGAEDWNLPRAVGVLKQVCQAVAHAHEKGVIHRDLKPSNVMVGRFGEVFVMDWGLARVLGANSIPSTTRRADSAVHSGCSHAELGAPDTQAGAVLGTPGYMAPEQAAGEIEKLDARTDVYALGAMLYHLLAGRAPRNRTTNMSTTEFVLRALNEPPERLSRAAPGAPVELAAICEQAMAEQKERRYASALELADDLGAWLEGRVVRAHRTGVWIEVKKWAQRNPLAAVAVLGLLLGGAVTTFVQLRLKHELEHRAEELRREGARNRIALASAALSNGEIGHLRELLSGCDPDLRGWEWNYLWHQANPGKPALEVEGIQLRTVGFLDAGRTLITGGNGDPSRILLWDRETRRLERELTLPPGHFINRVGVSANGEYLAVFGRLGELMLWQTCDWTELQNLAVPLHGWQGVEFAPAGTQLAAFGTEGVQVWDVETRACVAALSADQRDIADVAWSPDAERLCAASWDGSISVWDVGTGRLLELLRETTARMEQVEWSPDGRWIAGGDWDSRLHVWDARTLLAVHHSDRIEGQILALAWSPDSSLLAVSGIGTLIHLVEAGTWEEVGRLAGHAGRVQSLAFGPAGNLLASACSLGRVRLWDLADSRWRTFHRAAGESPPAAVVFAPEGERVAVGWGNGQVEIWNRRTRERELALETGAAVRHLDWSRTGLELAVAQWNEGIFLYALDTGRAPKKLALRTPSEVHFDPSGALLAATTQDGTMCVFELASSRQLWQERIPTESDRWPGSLFGGSWSASGEEVLCCAREGRIQVRSGFTGQLLRETQRPGMVFAQFSPDGGQILAWDYSGQRGMELLDSRTLALLWTSNPSGHMWPALAPDGTRIFSATWQGHLGVWDASSGRIVSEFEGLPPGNPRLGVSPDGDTVVLAVDRLLRFFDAR